jgi:RNA polymerase sigma-70 factor (ECF subfamily)
MTAELNLEETREMSELSLVVAAQRGDRQAFGQLVVRYERAVYAVVYRRLGNHAEAQEVSQEVFVKAMTKLSQLRHPECFGGWLRSAANRMAINRAVRRAPVIDAEPTTLAATVVTGETPLAAVLKSERKSQVRAGLRRLRKLDRETLVAFYVDGQSLIEMSNRFDSPVGTIKRRLHVARKRLARELEEFVGA